jgi:hypothetical protein
MTEFLVPEPEARVSPGATPTFSVSIPTNQAAGTIGATPALRALTQQSADAESDAGHARALFAAARKPGR